MASSEDMPVRRKITELRVVDLRLELEKRGLEKAGVKAFLVEKLQKALIEEGADPNEIVIDGSGAKGTSRKATPRRAAGKPDEDHSEELDTHELMDGEYLQVDSTGDQSMDGLSQEGELVLEGITVDDQITDEDVLGKLNSETIIDSIDDDMDDLNDDAINLTAEDDQLLTEDEAIGDNSEEAGASSIWVSLGTTDEDKFETSAATDSSATAPGRGGDSDANKAQIESVAPSTEKQEVDNESLIVHVDEPSLLELDADLTKPEDKAPAEESASACLPGQGQEEPSPGKEKWEFETQEKKDGSDSDEKAGQPVGSTDGEKNADNKAAGKDSTGDKKETPSASSTDGQKRSSTGSSSSKPGSEKDRRPGSAKSGGRNLWVCNLSKTTRAADLKAAFSKYGKVAGAKVVTNARSPGTLCYGFVMMSASSEAQRAMNHLHRTELHGRTIHVEWAGNDPVPGGRKPPLIPPSLLAAEKEKEAKEEAQTSPSEVAKTVKAEEKAKVKVEVASPESKDVKKPDATTPGKSPVKPEDKKPAVKKEPSTKEESQAQPRAASKEKSEKEKEKEKKDILSLDKIKEQRDKERHRNREREMREIERRRERERTEQFRRQRDLLRRRTREEEEKIRREREQLKMQRLQLEQERIERERLERERIRVQQERQREQERLERERALSMQLRIEQEHRSALKRTMDARGMPLHEMDPYMGEQKRRMAMETGLIPPVVIPPPMDMQGGMMNNQRGPDIGGDRRFDRRDHRGGDRREEQTGRFGAAGRFRDDARNHREERGQRRDDSRKDAGRRDDTRRDETRRSDPRREEGRREESRREDPRKEVPRREPPRREEPARREEASHRSEPSRRSDTRRDETAPRRDVREPRTSAPTHQRPVVHRREEPPKREEPARREPHQIGRFGGEKDERRVIATTRNVTTNRAERYEPRNTRTESNQFSNQQGDGAFQTRRRNDRDRTQPDTNRGREAERDRPGITQDRTRFDAGGDSHFQRRSSPNRSRTQQTRDSWKQDHHSNASSTDTRRVSGSHDSWNKNQQTAQQTSDRRVELRTVDHHHERPAAREIIDHTSSFNRTRMPDFQQDLAQNSTTWSSSGENRSIGSFSDRSMIRDTMQRHSTSNDMSAGMISGSSRSEQKWNAGRIDQALSTQPDRWAGGVSMTGMSSSLASGMTQASQPLNTMLGSAGATGFGTGFGSNALGNLINTMSGGGSTGGSNFGLDRRNMQTDNRFDSFQGVQGMRRF